MIHWSVRASLVAGVVLLTAAGVAGLVDRAPTTASALALQAEGPCEVEVDKVAEPSDVPFGSSVGLTLTFRRTCVDETPAVHLVVVIDGSMEDDDFDAAKRSAISRVRQMDLDGQPHSRVAVVEFSSSARRVCAFSRSESDLEACIQRIRKGAGSRVDLGLKEGVTQLRRERSEVESWRELGETIHMYTTAQDDEHCDAASREALSASRSGIFPDLICTGSNCNRECISDIEDAVASGGAKRTPLKPAFLPPASIFSLVITDTLAANMRLVPDSAEPPPQIDGEHLVWEHVNIASGSPVTITLDVDPLEVGEWPTNADAVAYYLGSRNEESTIAFPVPTVVVVEGPGFPTVTPTVRATYTPVPPTATPTSAVTTTPTPTPTQTEEPRLAVYLPLTVRIATLGEE